jgi:hypothetical protein
VSACPNGAIFVYHPKPVDVETVRVRRDDGGGFALEAGTGFRIAEDHQLAVFQGACNHCSNCEVYCPELGAPFREKELLFPSRTAFTESDADGFFREGNSLRARLEGREMVLSLRDADDLGVLTLGGGSVDIEWGSLRVLGGQSDDPGFAFDTALLWRMKTVWEAVYASPTPNPLNPEGG